MPQLTDEQRQQAQLAAASALVKKVDDLGTDVPALKNSMTALKEDLEKMRATNDRLKDLDVNKVLGLVDEIKAGQDQIRQMIRLSKGGIYVPGLGDEKKRFSIQRAVRAIVNKDWTDAGFEHDVFKASREAVTKGPGHIIGVDSQGGFFVPDQVIPDVIGAIYAQSLLINLDGSGQQRMSVLDGLVGMPVTIPKFIGGMIAYWIGEQDKYVESAVKAGNVTLRPRKLGVLTRITDEMRRFASYGFEALMRNDMVRAAAALIDYTAVYGTATDNMPRGVMNVPGAKVYSAETHSDTLPAGNWSGGELGFDDLMNMQGLVEDSSIPIGPSWAWIAPSRYYRRRRQDKVQYFSGQTSNFGYVVDGPMMTADRLKSLIGDYGASTVMPTTNTPGQSLGKTPNDANDKKYGDVIGANWADRIFARWGGVELSEDQGIGKGFQTDETYIKMRTYADFGDRNELSIVIAPDVKMRS